MLLSDSQKKRFFYILLFSFNGGSFQDIYFDSSAQSNLHLLGYKFNAKATYSVL